MKSGKEEQIKKLTKMYENYAVENDFRLNPNEKITKRILEGLIQNEKKYGNRYCPCRKVTNDPEFNKNIICPCIYHKDEIKAQGHCHCFLFVQKNTSS